MARITSVVLFLSTLALVGLSAGCASANKAKFRELDLTANSREEAESAALRALGRSYKGARMRGSVATAEPLQVDFGGTELEAVGTAIEQPLEVTQALGNVRRVPAIKIKKRDGLYTFEVRVERQVEEIETGYVQYENPYDYHEQSSMVTDPSRFGGTPAPPRSEWIPQGNDPTYEASLRAALAAELNRGG